MRLSNGMVLPYDTEIWVIWAPIWHSEMRDGPILTMWYFRNLLTFVVLQVPLWHPEMPDGSLYQKRICTFHEATCWPTLVNTTIDLTRVSAAFILLVIFFFKVRWSSSPHQVWYTGNQNWGITSFTEMQQVLSKLVEGGGARGCGGNPSDNHTWSKTFGSPPKCLCPNYHTQLDWFQYKLL